jgi:hypothetical protein
LVRQGIVIDIALDAPKLTPEDVRKLEAAYRASAERSGDPRLLHLISGAFDARRLGTTLRAPYPGRRTK